MRLTVGLLACLSTIVLSSQVVAADPVSQATAAPTPSQPATTSSSAQPPTTPVSTGASPVASASSKLAAGTPTADAPSVAAASALAASNPAKSGKPELTDIDRKLMSQGFTVERMRGTKYYCRNETIVGTRFDRKICSTPEEMADAQRLATDSTSRLQKGRNLLKGESPGPNLGGAGN